MQQTTTQKRHIPGFPDELIPDAENLVTEDDEPVDNFFSEKQQRLLTEPLYAGWTLENPETKEPRQFLAAANVGIYYALSPPIVPDVMVSLDVRVPADWWEKHNRCYMMWEFGKAPELVLEVVSNLKGGELGEKMERYERVKPLYYVVFDPSSQYGGAPLRFFRFDGKRFHAVEAIEPADFPLSLALWRGEYEGAEAEWLRWTDCEGNLVPTGKERADAERERADTERERADDESRRAEDERRRAEDERRRADAALARADIERERADAERERAENESRRAALASQQLDAERERVGQAESLLEQERAAKQRLEAKLRALGVSPDEL